MKRIIRPSSPQLTSIAFVIAFAAVGVRGMAAQTPDPLDANGDKLYSIWRRGLVTRHISANGRLLEYVGMESIDTVRGLPAADPSLWASFANGIRINHPANVTIKIPLANARYSVEESPEPVRPYLWVPIIAPVKNPGASNEGLFYVSGGGDNPLYYGGMAMATFALEHQLGVSKHSLEYARRLLPYFIESEVPVRSGNLVRRRRLLNSGNNPDGGPIIRGASAEELTGLMLGLMYFLRVEPAGTPWRREAEGLRDRVLAAVARDWGVSSPFNDYGHPFIPDIDKWKYKAKAFEYPMRRAFGQSGGRRWLYHAAVRGQGDLPSWADETYYNYLLIMVSSILMFDGSASATIKREFAEFYIDKFIRDVLRDSNYIDAMKRNGMLLATGLMAIRELVAAGSDLLNPPTDVQALFGTEWDEWQEVLKVLTAYNDSRSFNGVPFNWQHNLPWLNSKSPRSIWVNHNPMKNGGDWFTWVHQARYYAHDGTWNDGTPLMTGQTVTWPDLGSAMNEAEYFAATSKGYRAGTDFAERELCWVRRHCDTQVEGAGLGLLFPRMLFAELGVVAKPVLQPNETASLPSLPFTSASPIFPNTLKGIQKLRTNGSSGENFRVYGDRPDALRVTHLPKHYGKFVTLSATSDDKERLALWKVHPADVAGGRHIEKVWQLFTGDAYDNAQLLVTDMDGDEVVVIVERGEKKKTGYDDHFLRISTWKVTDTQLTLISKWENPIKDADSVKELDAWVGSFPDIDNKSTYVSVVFRSKSDINRLQVFRLERLGDRTIAPAMAEGLNIDSDNASLAKSHLTGFESGRLLVFTQRNSTSFRLVSRQLFPTGSNGIVSGVLATTPFVSGVPLDIQVVDWLWALQVVALVNRNGFLEYESWYLGRQNGHFIYAGKFGLTETNKTLVSRELLTTGPVFAEMAPLPAYYTEFGVIARSSGFSARNSTGAWRYGAPGVRVLRGRTNMAGIASPEGWGVTGGGEADGTKRLALSGAVCDGPNKQGCGMISVHADDERYMTIVFWSLDDPFLPYRWAAPLSAWSSQPQP